MNLKKEVKQERRMGYAAAVATFVCLFLLLWLLLGDLFKAVGAAVLVGLMLAFDVVSKEHYARANHYEVLDGLPRDAQEKINIFTK